MWLGLIFSLASKTVLQNQCFKKKKKHLTVLWWSSHVNYYLYKYSGLFQMFCITPVSLPQLFFHLLVPVGARLFF